MVHQDKLHKIPETLCVGWSPCPLLSGPPGYITSNVVHLTCWIEAPVYCSMVQQEKCTSNAGHLICWLEPLSIGQWSTRKNYINDRTHYVLVGAPVYCSGIHQGILHQLLYTLHVGWNTLSIAQWSTRINYIKYWTPYTGMLVETPIHCSVVHQDKLHHVLDTLCVGWSPHLLLSDPPR